MGENENEEKRPVEKVYIFNKNYKEYYDKKAKEEVEKNWRPTAKGGVLRGGRLSRPLLQSEIEDMQKQAQSAKHCARLLGVSYPTYKKYAKMYGIFENCKNEAGVGIHKLNKGRRSYALENILEGNNPSYPNWKLKKRLLETGYMPQVCANCGYDEPRVTDGKVPLLLDYMDGNRKNHKWDNLRMLCYNCWFQINGDLFGKAMRNVKKDAWDYQYIHK
jgi:hypothetical protein